MSDAPQDGAQPPIVTRPEVEAAGSRDVGNVDWAAMRERMADGDADALRFLSRYADPQTAYRSWRSAVAKLSDGSRVAPLGEHPSPEEVAAWNKAFGVPEKMEDYAITAQPPHGLQLSEADTGVLKSITEDLHKMLARGAKASDIVNFAHERYYDLAAQNIIGDEDRAAELAYDGEQRMRDLWGADYDKRIVGAIQSAQRYWPGDAESFENFWGQRLPSGVALFDTPEIQGLFDAIAHEMGGEDPFFRQTSANGSGAGFDTEKRIAAIRAMRGGTAEQRKQYQELSQPGGELERLLRRQEGRR
jgi:hypothetical protein